MKSLVLVVLLGAAGMSTTLPTSEEEVRQHMLLTKGERIQREAVDTPAYLELLYQYVNTKLDQDVLDSGILAKAFLPMAVTENKQRRLSLIFKYSEQLEDASSAELIFTVKRNVTENSVSRSIRVKVFLQRGSTHSPKLTIYKGLPFDPDDDADHHHVPIDVSAILHHHGLVKSDEPFIFHLDIKPKLSPSDLFHLDASSHQPLLVAYYGGTKPAPLGSTVSHWGRHRRSLEDKQQEVDIPITITTPMPDLDTKYCELRQWILPTEELRFPWMLLPKRLGPNYCAGTCPSPLHHSYYNSTTNALIIDRMRTISSTEYPHKLPESHCVPIEFSPTTLLMEESEGYFRLDIVHDLIVTRCGCR